MKTLADQIEILYRQSFNEGSELRLRNVLLSLANGQGAGQSFPDGTVLSLDFGLLPAGTDISGLSATQLISQAFAGYVAPIFSAFAISGSTTVEVGTQISGNRNFSFSLSNGSNVEPDTLDILDVTNGNTAIAENQPVSSPVTADIGTIENNAPATQQYRAQATDTQGTDFQSGLATISWKFKRFYGFVPSDAPNDATIQALDSDFTQSPVLSPTSINNGGGSNYPAIFIPESEIPGSGAYNTRLQVWVGGFNVTSAWVFTQFSFTNAQGVTESYVRIVQNSPTAASSLTIETRLP